MSKVTARQISESSGVSPATVSRVLRGTTKVSPALRRKVLEVAAQIGYKSSNTEKSGSSGCKLIGLIIPNLSNPFYSEIIDGIQDTAASAGYSLIISQAKINSSDEASIFPSFLEEENIISGLISLLLIKESSWFFHTIPEGMPVVQCCEYNTQLPYPSVSIDDYSAAYNATTYLLNTGRQKLALFNSSCHTLYGKLREEGFRAAMAAASVPINESYVIHLGEVDYNLAVAAALDMFAAPDHPDAVFAVSDIYATGVIRSIRKAGLCVPEDVSVIGFDDTEIALISDPPLTTIHQPRYKIGCTAFNILLRMISTGDAPSQRLFVESDLVVRGTT